MSETHPFYFATLSGNANVAYISSLTTMDEDEHHWDEEYLPLVIFTSVMRSKNIPRN